MKCERLLCKVVDALWSYDAPPPPPPPPLVETPWWVYVAAVAVVLVVAAIKCHWSKWNN